MTYRLLIFLICLFSTGCIPYIIQEHQRWQKATIRQNHERGLVFERFLQNPVGLFPFDATVGTDSAEIHFSEEYASFVEVKGVRYLHGSTFPDLEYHAIPLSEIRYLALDWPIRVILLDGTSVRAEEGEWKIMYENGEISAVKTWILIPVHEIDRIESGYEHPFE